MNIVADWISKLIKALAEWVDRCLPKYEPGMWNDNDGIQHSNNCYNYACDIQTNSYAQPGYAHGITLPPYYENGTCKEVTAGATADGLAVTGCDEGCGCGECHHQVALVIRPNQSGYSIWDYHWYRKDQDGRWSHKMGQTQATNLDNSGNIIADPKTADRGSYTVYCGCFCVNKTQVTIDGPY
jgi:hypothetical protein